MWTLVADAGGVGSLVAHAGDVGSLVAHAGGVGSLLSLVTVLAGGVVVVFVGAAAGRIRLRSGDDLVLPLAAVAVVSSAAPLLGDLLSDAAAPAAVGGVVLLGALVICATTPLDIRHPAVALTAVALAVVTAVVLGPPLAEGPWRDRPDPEVSPRAITPAAAPTAADRPPRASDDLRGR